MANQTIAAAIGFTSMMHKYPLDRSTGDTDLSLGAAPLGVWHGPLMALPNITWGEVLG